VQAGQTAGKGMDGIADGAKRAADGFNREEGRMRASIQRATLDLNSLGKTASEKIEAQDQPAGARCGEVPAVHRRPEAGEDAQQRLQQQRSPRTSPSGLQAQIAGLREQIQLQSRSTDEVLRYKAAQAGASEAPNR
jgi:hypothetical protein